MLFSESGNRISVRIVGAFGAEEVSVTVVPIGVFFAEINFPAAAG